MLCEICEGKTATVHLTQMVNNEVRKLHLCEQCAAKSGLDVNGAMSITDVLLGLGGQSDPKTEDADKICLNCKMRLDEFRKSSRLGCEQCYATFADELTPLLESMHRGLQHVGKKPANAPAAITTGADLKKLRGLLNAAVTAENFEEAARLRDQIRSLENSGDHSL